MPRVSCYYIYTIVSLTFIFMLLYSIVFGEREVIFLLLLQQLPSSKFVARYVRLFVAIGSRSRGLGSCCRRYLFRGHVFFTNCPRTLVTSLTVFYSHINFFRISLFALLGEIGDGQSSSLGTRRGDVGVIDDSIGIVGDNVVRLHFRRRCM